MRKKLMTILTLCLLVFSMCACGSAGTDKTTAELGTLTFDVPEGFVETQANYYASEDGSKLSNINIYSTPNDGSFKTATSKILLPAIESELESATGTDLTLTLLDEESYEVDGCRAYKYSYEYELMGSVARQMQCIVETADEFIFVTFSEFNNEGTFDAFKTAAESIRFE